ncbi:ABC transporter substrate-binding protein [Siccirubricoccus phaeus]|uniref:ABC transporter substrate-binding protein n=1 Tax=Siccirubricoccus phaeus TaxID=2595053 RepID=UPI0011F210CE|nr:ABC transporter substrate-binding protein [Siccirubricoccus phaeus]
MGIHRRTVLQAGAATAAAGLSRRRARAQAANTIRIALLTDMAGQYKDNTGPTQLACVRQAAAEFANRGFNIEVLAGDNQNRPDIGSNLVRAWIDRSGVDVIVDGGASSVALAINDIIRDRNKVYLNSTSATSDLTGKACSPNTVHWTYDTWMLAKTVGTAMVKDGGDSWYFLTADYAFGHALERDTAAFVRSAGGTIVGGVRTPFPDFQDFSSFLVQARASRAKVIGLANSGTDTINCIKQAAEFGLTQRGVRLAALLMVLPVVAALGLPTAQGLVCSETFYWDLNDRTRRFTAKMRPQVSVPLCMTHVGGYSSVLHYLKVIADMGVAQAKASGVEVVNRMKAMPCDDDCFGPGSIRADGRKIHPAYLFQVKSPQESSGGWDYYKLLQTTPAEEAFRPLSEGGCPLVRG